MPSEGENTLLAASRAICSFGWPMKLGLARSVACLGSGFRGLCYQLWSGGAAKVCARVHVGVLFYAIMFYFVLNSLSFEEVGHGLHNIESSAHLCVCVCVWI